jgi:xanthine dehydrogenase accessory factor
MHLREEGLTDADLQRLTSPIGVPGIRSKEPAAIAVAVAAQLLQVRERLVACGSKRATSAVVRSA